ncbi:MAG: HEAT repeat domain-containing protein, partial [Candidatus Aminicenantes bacterium]
MNFIKRQIKVLKIKNFPFVLLNCNQGNNETSSIVYESALGNTINRPKKHHIIIVNLILFSLFVFVIGCGRSKLEKATDALIQALKDEDSNVRGEAAYVLGEIKSIKAT